MTLAGAGGGQHDIIKCVIVESHAWRGAGRGGQDHVSRGEHFSFGGYMHILYNQNKKRFCVGMWIFKHNYNYSTLVTLFVLFTVFIMRTYVGPFKRLKVLHLPMAAARDGEEHSFFSKYGSL